MLLLIFSLCTFVLVRQVLVDLQDLRGRALVLVHLQEDAVDNLSALLLLPQKKWRKKGHSGEGKDLFRQSVNFSDGAYEGDAMMAGLHM